MLPPSSVIVAPLTYAPPLELRKMQSPAASSGLPILPSGTRPTIASPKFSSVAFITAKGSQPAMRS